MNIIIIEDEKPAARLLQRKLEKIGLQVTTMLHSVEESILWFQENKHPDPAQCQAAVNQPGHGLVGVGGAVPGPDHAGP